MHLQDLGWSTFFQSGLQALGEADLVPARVVTRVRDSYRLATGDGEVAAELAGALRYRAGGADELPAVGDWVAARLYAGDGLAIIHSVLPRATALIRRGAGRAGEAQVLAANVTAVFIVTSCNQELNPRRLERYLALASHGGASAVVVLSKSDLVADPEPLRRRAEAVAEGAPVHAVSTLAGAGLEALAPYLGRGRTVALLGSSGVGKSTLVNHLLGRELQAVREIRARDDRGRHATTRRELIPLPGGGMVVDTPGLRELGLWSDETGAAGAFGDIEELAAGCRFRDCGHEEEPGCAVAAAVAAGSLDPARLASFHKLAREAIYLEDRLRVSANYAEKRKWRALMQGLERKKR